MPATKPRLVTRCDVSYDMWGHGTGMAYLGMCGRCPSHNIVVSPSLLSVVDLGGSYSVGEEDSFNFGFVLS